MYSCTHDYCNAPFSKPSRLQRHISKHNKVRYACGHCAKSYFRKDKYELHLLNHDNEVNAESEADDGADDIVEPYVGSSFVEPWFAGDVVELYSGDVVEHYASNVAVETNNLAEYPPVYILDEDTHLAANIEHFNNYENTSLYSQLEFDSRVRTMYFETSYTTEAPGEEKFYQVAGVCQALYVVVR